MIKHPIEKNPIIEYYNQIVNGDVIVGQKVRRIYQKLVDDIHKPKGVYVYDKSRAEHAVNFIEKYCKHSKGSWAGKPIILELWQEAAISAMFGFIDKLTGFRQFREIFWVVARKNGKSTISSGIAVYLMLGDGEAGAEVYTVATKKEQARITWDESKRMIQKSPALLKRTRPLINQVVSDWNDSVLKPLSSDFGTLDGLNSSGIIGDEVAAWKTKELYDIVSDSTSARDQPLTLLITTNGTVRESIFDQKYTEAVDTLSGFDNPDGWVNDTFLPIIYELDDREEWRNPDMWYKANPGLGTIKKYDQLETKVNKAKNDSLLIRNLLTKDFNMAESSTDSWLNLKDIQNDAMFDMEDIRGSYCLGGVDLSSTTDLTCATIVVMKPDSDQKYVLQQYFIPDELIAKKVEQDKVPYNIWKERGFVKGTDGQKVDYSAVTAWFKMLRDEWDIHPLWIGYDSWNSQYWITEMENEGFVMTEVRQTAKIMSQPMKIMGADLKGKKINYNMNPILQWNLTNTRIKVDDNENIRPVKGLSQKQRIDGAVSLIIVYCVLQNNMQDYQNMI